MAATQGPARGKSTRAALKRSNSEKILMKKWRESRQQVSDGRITAKLKMALIDNRNADDGDINVDAQMAS